MIYDIDHLTAYSYASPVTSATLALRLTPRTDGVQRNLSHQIEVVPRPDHVSSEYDFFGNSVDVVAIDTQHTELSIKSSARVEVSERPLPLEQDRPWEEVAAEALSGRDLSSAAPAHFLFSSPQIAIDRDLTLYAGESFSEGRGMIDACMDLTARIQREFDYRPDTTSVSTAITEAFRQRSGVCQDFAQIMIGGLRGLGLPAAYVSGYLRTVPPPGTARLQGADATHAWVTVWTGPETGWIGFDPTNAVYAGSDHISIAVGRDFSDVSPIYGVFVGSGETELRVEVDVVPLSEQP